MRRVRAGAIDAMLALAAAGCAGCGPPDGPPCDADPLTVEIGSAGTSGEGFVAIDHDGQDVPLIHGSQGGFHLWMHVRAENACPRAVELDQRAYDAGEDRQLYLARVHVELHDGFLPSA